MPTQQFYPLSHVIFKHLRFDMIFIDGCHDQEAVEADLVGCVPLLKPAGLLCGHDAQHKGVRAALKKLPSVKHVPNTSIWYMG